MSSLAGQQGSPDLAVYAATKAFDMVLAEGLWGEMRRHGVDVVTAVAGAVATPGLGRSTRRAAPGAVTPDEVVAAALAGLGRGPRTIPAVHPDPLGGRRRVPAVGVPGGDVHEAGGTGSSPSIEASTSSRRRDTSVTPAMWDSTR